QTERAGDDEERLPGSHDGLPSAAMARFITRRAPVVCGPVVTLWPAGQVALPRTARQADRKELGMRRHRPTRVIAFAAALAIAPRISAAGPLTMLGADVSSVQRTLDLGGRYFDAAGTARDPLDILKSIGVNYIRLRVWNNPASGTNNKAKVLTYAKTVKAKGLKLMIDFHYSDTWA